MNDFKKSFIYKIRIRKPILKLIPFTSIIDPPKLSNEKIISSRNQLNDTNSILLGYFGFIYGLENAIYDARFSKISKSKDREIKLLLCGDFQEDRLKDKEKFFSYIKNNNLEDNIIFKGYVKDEIKLILIYLLVMQKVALYKDGLTARRSTFWYLNRA